MRKFLLSSAAVLLLIAGLLSTLVAQTADSDATSERPIAEMRKDMKAFIKRSKSDDQTKMYAAVVDLCALHREIVTDSRYDSNPSLVNLRAQVGNRLKKCQQAIELTELRAARALARENRNAEPPAGDAELLESEIEPNYEYVLAQELSQHLHFASQMTGGPSQVFSYANGNFGPGDAQDLIRLIETTISPDTWRTNGGDGRMFFYRPACALVVSASAQTQDRLNDLLRQMRKLSR